MKNRYKPHIPDLVTASEFVLRTGLHRRSFYNILNKLKELGIAAKNQRQIDMKHQWVENYLATNGVGQRKHLEPVEPKNPKAFFHGKPTIQELQYFESFGKVEKLFLENAIKKNSVVALPLVEALINKIDESLIRIIMDGESSFVPQMCKKVRGGATDEDIKKYWRSEIGKFIKPVKNFMIKELKKHV